MKVKKVKLERDWEISLQIEWYKSKCCGNTDNMGKRHFVHCVVQYIY